MTYWIMGRDHDYDPQGRKHAIRQQAGDRVNAKLAALKARTDKAARWTLERFQQLRDQGWASEAALEQAEDEWDERVAAERDAEDTGRWYRSPHGLREW